MAEGADRTDALLLWRRASKDRHTPSETQGSDRTGAFLPGQTGRTELTGWVMKTKQIAQTREMLEKEGKGMPEESRQAFPTRTSMLFYFLKGSKRYFVLCVLFSMCVSFLDLVNPKLIGYTVDSVIGNEAALLPSYAAWLLQFLFGSTENIHGRVGQMAVVVIVVAAVSGVCRYFTNLFNSIGSESLVLRMRNLLFDHTLHLPFAWHNKNHTGDIIQRCTSDVETVRSFISEQLVQLFRIIILIGFSMYFMAEINGTLTLIAFCFIPVIVGYSLIFFRKIGSAFEHADVEEGKLSAIAQENLTGVRVVRAFGREEYERERFESKNRDYTKMWIRLMKLMSAFWAIGDLMSSAQIITLMAVGAVMCVRGNLTAGQFIAFATYSSMIAWPIRAIGRVISGMSKAGISIDRIREIMNAPVEKDDPKAGEPDIHGDICFDHVSFRYSPELPDVLSDVSFTVRRGETVGILGGTGSGKSTLMYLLDRLYQLPKESGTVSIGGVDIQKFRMEYLRKNIGLVLQEPYLFSRSLGDNIRIAGNNVTQADVDEAARISCLDEAVGKFRDGYDTPVGERGVTLSGGQKQRAAIAQMLVRKPPIMIFDDSLSAVDAETDAKIRHGLKQGTGDATVILIAHRITTLMQADRIIVLDKGKVAEEGTHEQLLEKNGIYRRIYDLQLAGSRL